MTTSDQDAATNTVKRSEGLGNQNSTGLFNFTEPAPVMPGVDVDEYFTPTTLEELAKIVEEAQEDAADKEKRDGRKNMISDKRMTMEGCQAEIHSHIEFVSDYTSYLKALGVNAATSISGYGQEASVSGSYLDESAFSSNSLTFIASITINKQRRVSNEQFTFNTKLYDTAGQFSTRFGNRWIRGFEMGGKLMARIMLTFDEASDKEEIKAAAGASLSFWGVSGKLSTEVKNNMEKLSKKAQVKVKIFYQGDIGRQLQGRSEASDGKSSAQQIFSTAKSWADTFLEMACSQDYTYQAVLDTYPNIGNFPQSQSIAHYTTAGAVAYLVLGEMVKHTELRKTLQTRGALSQEEDLEIRQHEIELIDAQKNWLRETARSPDNALHTAKDVLGKSSEYYKKWKPYLTPEPSPVEIKAFSRLVSEQDPDTKKQTSYDCSESYEWYSGDGYGWSKVRFCLPTHTDVFQLAVFRERSEYKWGWVWYNEDNKYRADVTVGVTLIKLDPKPSVWTFEKDWTRNKSFNTVYKQEKLLPGRYKVHVNYYQNGPYWEGTTIRQIREFEFTAS